MKETALDKLKELVELDKITKIIYFSSKRTVNNVITIII